MHINPFVNSNFKFSKMKKIGIALLSLAFIGTSLAFTLTSGDDTHPILEIGTKAPLSDLGMKDISGTTMSLDDIAMDNGVMVIFSCNTCPFVVGADGYGTGWQDRYNELHALGKRNGVGVVLVNSNEAKRSGDESFDQMQQQAEVEGYHPFYVMDKDHKLADAFGAKTTPHVFLFDKDMKLAYKGAIDDNNADASQVTERYAYNAILSLAKGEACSPNSTRQKGCSIKRSK